MEKVTSVSGASKYSKKCKLNGKTIGFIVGSFDVIHLGHINLLRFAKKYVDKLIVGIDNDETVKLVKGKNRPINNAKYRASLLSELISVDRLFVIPNISHHDSEEAVQYYKNILWKIKPNMIFTHKVCDRHWKEKQKIAKDIGIKFKTDTTKKITHSGDIIKVLMTDL